MIANPYELFDIASDQQDQTLLENYMLTMVQQLSLVLTVMQVQDQWTVTLMNDRNQYLYLEIQPNPAAPGEAKAAQTYYDVDATKQQSDTAAWQSILEGNQNAIKQASGARGANFDVAASQQKTLAYSQQLVASWAAAAA